ncbi:hypothetical protein BJ138DRAFT_1178146 [Hygrophoropsis aurantiaca]|uniref:Uncharacterized protein n=1 Tax=Hygrophoropsis aurantiaca TaxID=72124 RepID=A0ACB8AJ96_9AGAM|nr:hypothetical protein BJ138DRAFT_1178146 [Hygrophoropsis aurantiaca]
MSTAHPTKLVKYAVNPDIVKPATVSFASCRHLLQPEIPSVTNGQERTGMNAIEQIPSARGRRRAHQAACLLDMTNEVPSPSDMEVNQYCVVQACYEAMEGQAATEGFSQRIHHENNSNPPRRIFYVSFIIPLKNVQTTSAEVSFPSDTTSIPDDIFTRICASIHQHRFHGQSVAHPKVRSDTYLVFSG